MKNILFHNKIIFKKRKNIETLSVEFSKRSYADKKIFFNRK